MEIEIVREQPVEVNRVLQSNMCRTFNWLWATCWT